jgi:hypothetical protein
MIALTPTETELVLATLDVPADLRNRLAHEGRARVLSGDDVDLLVDLATDRLMVGGFDASYRPTVEGAALERLIDRLVAEDADAGAT